MGKLRNLGLAALAFILLGGPGSKVIAEDPVKPKKPKQKLVQVVKKEEEKETPWTEQVVLKLEQHVSSEYDSTVVKDLRVIVVNDGVAHARASIDEVDYAFKEHKTGITAILRTDKRLIVLNNHDKKDGFEDVSWINLDGKTIPWDQTLPQRKDNPAAFKKDYYLGGKERIPPGEVYEQELKSVLLVDFSRSLRKEFSKVFKDIDLKRYDNILTDIVETNKLHRTYSFVTRVDYMDDLMVFPAQGVPKKFFLKRFVKDIQKIKDSGWSENLVCEYAAQQGKDNRVVFRVNKEEKGEKYTLLMHTERDGTSSSTEYVLHPSKEITITKKFSKTPKVKSESGLITAAIKYTPTKEGGILEHKHIDLDNAKRLLDFMNPIFQKMLKIYQKNKK